MPWTCEYCNKVISSRGNLIKHQKTQKCLQRQKASRELAVQQEEGSIRAQEREEERARSEKYRLLLEEARRDLDEAKQKIAYLEAKVEFLVDSDKEAKRIIEEIAREPKTVNNSVGNSVRDTRMVNLLLPAIDTSQETIDRTVQCSYKMDHFCSGQKGVAMFAIDHLLKDTRGQLGYVCTDPSRGVFKHLDDEGEVVRDLGAAKLTSKLAKPIRSKAGILAKELTGEGEEMFAVAIKNLRDIANISENNSGFRTALANGTVQ